MIRRGTQWEINITIFFLPFFFSNGKGKVAENLIKIHSKKR